jgi:hypothetical protein
VAGADARGLLFLRRFGPDLVFRALVRALLLKGFRKLPAK